MEPRFSLFLFLFALYLPSTSTAAIATPTTPSPAVTSLQSVPSTYVTPTENTALAKAKRRARREARQHQEPPARNGMAVAGFVCSLVGLFFFGIVLGPLGITFSAIGLSRANKEGRPKRGLAIAGLVVGIIATVGWYTLVVAAVATME